MNQNISRIRPRAQSLLALVTTLAIEGTAFAACFFGLSSMASAGVVNIPAITFLPRNISEFVHTTEGYVKQGVLEGGFGDFYAPVEFPSDGKICAFTLVYRDNTQLGYVAAKLFKKSFSLGQSPFTDPIQVAALQTTGADPATHRLVERNIVGPGIDLNNAFYYVELSVSLNVQVLGVQVYYRPDNCPK